MLATLRSISKGYHTADEIIDNCDKWRALDSESALAMLYENMQIEAKNAIKWVKPIK